MIFVDPATTNARLCMKLAGRMNMALKQALGHGVDVQRVVDDPLYARDVLLVCDALRDHHAGGTSALAQQFRQAKRGVTPSPATGAGDGSHGFSASRFLSSIFGPLSTRDADTGRAGAAGRGAEAARTRVGLDR